jgi:hypothetical protein
VKETDIRYRYLRKKLPLALEASSVYQEWHKINFLMPHASIAALIF